MKKNPKKRNPHKLLYLRVKKKKVIFTKEESIDLILHCTKQEKTLNFPLKKPLIIFLGNTGSGKSTLINYILNCTLKKKKAPKILKNILTEEIIIVKPKSKGGKRDEIMKIGHTVDSSTFKPFVFFDVKSGLNFMDCPGFEDNRGEEINISNGVNVRNIVETVENVKLVVLIHFLSFFNDRAKCFDRLLNNCSRFFGNVRNFRNNKDSLILVISHCPTDFNLKRIKSFFENNDNELIRSLNNRIFAYDPLDTENKYFLKREEILEKIKSCDNIYNPKQLFETVLTDKDLLFLLDLGISFKKMIKFNLENGNFKEAAENFKNLSRLKVVNLNFLKMIFEQIEKNIIFFLKKLKKKLIIIR